MAYAVFTSGNKQYRVTVGDVLTVDRISGLVNDGETTFDQVLLVEDGDATKVGTPTVAGATVTAKVLDAEARGAKGIAFKFKRRAQFPFINDVAVIANSHTTFNVINNHRLSVCNSD